MFFKVNNAGAKDDSIAMFCLSLLITEQISNIDLQNICSQILW